LPPSLACWASQTHDETILSDTTLGSLLRSQGQIIGQAEQAEVAAVATRTDLDSLDLTLVPPEQPRRRAGWPAGLNAAVDAALAAEQVRPPEGVSWADWERVVAARRTQATCAALELRDLGPEVEPNQVLLSVDEVLTRKPEAGHFVELRTGRLVTQRGSRYLSGIGAAFLQRVHLGVLLCLEPLSSLLLIADRARCPSLVYRDPRRAHGQDDGSRLAAPQAEMLRAQQSKLSRQAGQSPPARSAVSTLVAGRCRGRDSRAGERTPADEQRGEA
jgi:hypothetical protein